MAEAESGNGAKSLSLEGKVPNEVRRMRWHLVSAAGYGGGSARPLSQIVIKNNRNAPGGNHLAGGIFTTDWLCLDENDCTVQQTAYGAFFFGTGGRS